MKTLFDAGAADEIRSRVARLTPDGKPQWGKMNAPQMLAHLAVSFEQGMGENKPPRMMIGRLIGGMIKPIALGEKPFGRNAPTAPSLRIVDTREFEKERARFLGTVDRLAKSGPAGCTDHPHPFFGKLKAQEWGRLMYKHADHHLQQFGV